MVADVFPSSPIPALVIVAVLVVVSRPIIVRVAHAEGKPWLIRIMTIGLILHLVAAPAQIFVVHHFYHGVADWVRYDHQGAALAPQFRHFDFSLQGNTYGIVNDESVSIAGGVVFAIVGINQLAAFFVFAWLSFLGGVLFFRAFSLTFAGADSRRYAYLMFFLPSLLFWTADLSKEAVMTPALGLVAYGAAKILARRRGGYSLAALGVAIGIPIRPNELMVVMAGFTVAMLIQPVGDRRRFGAGRRVFSIVFFGALLAASVYLTVHYLTSKGSFSLNQTAQNNSSGNSTIGFGSGGVPYSTNVITYPRDIYEILFNPLPFNFHGLGELIAAFENTVLLVVLFRSLRQLRMVPRAAFARPYVMMCVIYCAGFFYAFAALGNLGLIERERVLLLPFLLVLMSIPVSPKGQRRRYEWEYRRGQRLRLRQAGRFRTPPPASSGGTAPPVRLPSGG
jgi:hypothetical protein